MPRKNRIHYYSAIYHVMARGNNKQDIFFDSKDRDYFYSLLNRIVIEFNCEIHLFCLMPNHIHLVLGEKYIPLPKIMQSLLATYARYINNKYHRVGHLFQDRYQSKPIQNENYLMQLCYYIHMNPVKSGIVERAADYPWSSHLIYLNQTKIPWLSKKLISDILTSQFLNEENAYLKFINTANTYLKEAPLNSGKFDLYFLEDKVTKRINARKFFLLDHLSLQTIQRAVCESLGVSEERLLSESMDRKIVFARGMVAYFSHYHGGYLLKDIAILLQLHPNAISRTIRRSLNNISLDKNQQYHFNMLKKKFSQYR